MQFPQINKYESLIERHLRPSFDPLHALSFDPEPLPRAQLAEILSDIEEINLARSYHHQPHHPEPSTPNTPPSHFKSNGSEETHQCDREALTFLSERKGKRNTNKSLIFTQQNFSKHKEAKGEKSIRVHYFNLPTFKMLPYHSGTTVAELTRLAVEAYCQDKQLDPSKIKDAAPHNYQLHLPDGEGSHQADMEVEPIAPSRFLADNLFDSLILLRKRQTPSLQKEQGEVVVLFNELGEELGQVAMGRCDSLQKVFDYIESNDLHQVPNYFLTQNQNDEDPLPKDLQIRNLDSNRIYIKCKRFIDESEQEGTRTKVIRSLTILKEKEPAHISASTLPIGLSEASLYEEFPVIKVNNLGAEQQRILGIDQHKLYNYDRSLREEKKQSSFLSKIFGVNRETGTKRPYRYISDIQQVAPLERGFQLVFPDKTIKYYTATPYLKEKILRKINYLVAYTNGHRKT